MPIGILTKHPTDGMGLRRSWTDWSLATLTDWATTSVDAQSVSAADETRFGNVITRRFIATSTDATTGRILLKPKDI